MSNESSDLVAGDAILGKISSAINEQRASVYGTVKKLVEDTKRQAAQRAWNVCPCKETFSKCTIVKAIMEED